VKDWRWADSTAPGTVTGSAQGDSSPCITAVSGGCCVEPANGKLIIEGRVVGNDVVLSLLWPKVANLKRGLFVGSPNIFNQINSTDFIQWAKELIVKTIRTRAKNLLLVSLIQNQSPWFYVCCCPRKYRQCPAKCPRGRRRRCLNTACTVWRPSTVCTCWKKYKSMSNNQMLESTTVVPLLLPPCIIAATASKSTPGKVELWAFDLGSLSNATESIFDPENR